MKLIDLPQERENWQAVANMVMNLLLVALNGGIGMNVSAAVSF